VAIGQAGLTWASGVHLGNTVAQVRVNEENASTFTFLYTKSQLRQYLGRSRSLDGRGKQGRCFAAI